MDSGAEKAGWAVLEDGPLYIDSGVERFHRWKDLPFQEYRLELEDFWVIRTEQLIDKYEPELIVTEIVPSRGAAISDQLYLANTQATVVHAIAMSRRILTGQVSAIKPQKYVTKSKAKRITKTQVRNGVLETFPQLKDQLKFDWKQKVYERSDALAIGLFVLDYLKKSK